MALVNLEVNFGNMYANGDFYIVCSGNDIFNFLDKRLDKLLI